jgi:hypothetical protein
MEQSSNALALEQLKLGYTMKYLDKEKVEAFLHSRESRKISLPDVAFHIAQWLEKGEWQDVQPLAAECWGLAA